MSDEMALQFFFWSKRTDIKWIILLSVLNTSTPLLNHTYIGTNDSNSYNDTLVDHLTWNLYTDQLTWNLYTNIS